MNKLFQIFKTKDLRNKILIVGFLLTAFFISGNFLFFANINNVNAEEITDFPPVLEMPGTIKGIGAHFEITNSEYLNITLDSSELIKLRMESIPEMITMMIEPLASSTAQTQITLSGFAPLTKYYKYQDDYHNLTEFITDENGQYVYIQDLPKPYFVFIQPRKSTKFIKDDLTGGDCYLIGNWDWNTKTCTLTTDVYETIQVDNDRIILDGNSHTITGSNTGYGVYLIGRYGVNIKNLNIKKFSIGVYLYYSNYNILTNNNVSTNSYSGIVLNFSYCNIITNNTATQNNYYGISDTSGYNIFKNNTVSNNNAGFFIQSLNSSFIENVISNNYVGVSFYGGRNNFLTENVINLNKNGISLVYAVNNQIYNNNFINNLTQVHSYGSSGNIFNLSVPIGGNYWNNFDIPPEGCSDLNNDNFCDSPYIFPGGQDNLPWTKQDGWKIPVNQPPAVSNLGQFKSDGQTPINESSITTENIVVFKATLSDPDNDQIKLQVELKEYNQPFNEQNLLESDFINSGSEATIIKYGLVDGQYHWWARAVDDKGNTSQWQEFGTAGNVDFEVKLLLSTKAAILAKELISYPYLLGGKGWDYNQNEFVAPNTVKTGYSFWNQKVGYTDFGAGVDCSGLIMWSYNRSFDPSKSRLDNFVKVEGADEQYNGNTATTTESQLQPGDVIFFDWGRWHEDIQAWDGIKDGYIDHVAMYVGESGGFDVVNASSRREGIVARSKDTLKNIAGFVVFKQVVSALPPPILVSAYSPVDLIVTDPDGFTITPTTTIPSDLEFLREIPGVFYYLEMERGPDGNPIDQVYSYIAKTGDYIVKILPTANTSPTSTYTLDFSVANQSMTLAQDVPISQIPANGYGITTSETGAISHFIPVAIDIKPDSYPNSINLKSDGVTPVAILGSTAFDVKQIDPTTIKLANASVKLKNNDKPMISYEDVNRDGFTDIIIHIITKDVQLTPNEVKANIEGQLTNGIIIKGSDSVRIVP